MKHSEIFMNFDEICQQINPKAADIFIYNNYCAVKYKNHVISEYVKDGKYYYLIEGEQTDIAKFIAVCGDDLEGSVDDDGNETITSENVIACFDEYGRLRHIDKCVSIKTAIQGYIEDLDRRYGNAIPVFGGAYHIDHDFESIIRYFPNVLRYAKMWDWHENPADTLRTFCHCCFVDPALVEIFIGMKFENLVA